MTSALGSDLINSDKAYQSHGVAITSMSVSGVMNHQSVVSADDIDNSLGSLFGGNPITNIGDWWSNMKAKVSPKNQDLPSDTYGVQQFWARAYAGDPKTNKDVKEKVAWVSKYTMMLRRSNSIVSYKSTDALSTIGHSFGQIMAFIGGILLVVLLGAVSFVQGIGAFIMKVVGYLNIFKYIGMGLHGAQASGGLAGTFYNGLKPLIDIWVQFKEPILLVATLIFMFVIVRTVMGSQNRGRTLGTGFAKYMVVFFAWTMLPVMLGTMLSYSETVAGKMNLTDQVSKQIKSNFYNAQAPFAASFYTFGSDKSGDNRGGITSGRVSDSWSHNPALGLQKRSGMGVLTSWMSSDSFDADDVSAWLGWSGEDKDTDNKGYFAHKVSVKDKKVTSEPDKKGKVWGDTHKFLNNKDRLPQKFITDKNLDASGFNKDLFAQTASGSNYSIEGSDRLRKLALTHALAVWGINSDGEIAVSRQTGMNTDPRVSWKSTNLVGDTVIARFNNWLQIFMTSFWVMFYAIVAYMAIATILAKTIGSALGDQIRASSGSIGAVVRALIGVAVGLVMVAYISLSVGMVGPLLNAMVQLLKGVTSTLTGGSAFGNVTGQLVSSFVLIFGGKFIVDLLIKLRGAITQSLETMMDQIAEAIDRAMGIQPGQNGSVSNSIHDKADQMRERTAKSTQFMQKSSDRMTGGIGKGAGRLAGKLGGGLKNTADDMNRRLDEDEMQNGALDAQGSKLGQIANRGKHAAKMAGALATGGAGGALLAASQIPGVMGASKDAGRKNVAKETGKSAKEAYQDARNNGATVGEAVKEAADKAKDTATMQTADTGNEQYDAASNVKGLQAQKRQNGQDLKRTSQQQRKITDATSDLTKHEKQYQQALQEQGASEAANKYGDGKTTNADAREQAGQQLKQAKQTSTKTGTERMEQAQTLKKARQNVLNSREELQAAQSQVNQDVQSQGKATPEAQQKLAQAKQDYRQSREAYAKESQTMDTLVKKDQTAKDNLRQAQGASQYVAQQTKGNDDKAAFKPAKGTQTVSQASQNVTDSHQQLLNSQHQVNNLLKEQGISTSNNQTVDQTKHQAKNAVTQLASQSNEYRQNYVQAQKDLVEQSSRLEKAQQVNANSSQNQQQTVNQRQSINQATKNMVGRDMTRTTSTAQVDHVKNIANSQQTVQQSNVANNRMNRNVNSSQNNKFVDSVQTNQRNSGVTNRQTNVKNSNLVHDTVKSNQSVQHQNSFQGGGTVDTTAPQQTTSRPMTGNVNSAPRQQAPVTNRSSAPQPNRSVNPQQAPQRSGANMNVNRPNSQGSTTGSNPVTQQPRRKPTGGSGSQGLTDGIRQAKKKK